LRVPDDISVTGFDDIGYAKFCDPSLTTIAQPAEEMGRASLDLLLRIIEGESPGEAEYIMPTEFIIRDSTAPRK
jgi:LacI family transcriptional regulator, repressor for deo operon, udp, cdd, tsx, nupC, and nupG